MPLFSVDTHHDAGSFDVVAFGLAAELVYTNVLECLDLAGIPVRAEDRRPEHPIVVAGGHCAFNPEPMADFVDVFVIGDGEEAIGEITEVVVGVEALGPHRPRGRAARAGDDPRRLRARDVRRRLRRPVHRRDPPRFDDVPERVDKRTVADLAEWPYPKQQLVPLIEVVHDRLNVEVFRGCTRGCRFCQAGMITRPVRERPEDQVRTMVRDGLRRTGYDEVALTSLSTADFSGIDGLVAGIVNEQEGCGNVSLSLPSLRVDAFTVGIASEIQKVRRTGLTFAPEGGTWRIRQVINKLITDDDLFAAVDGAYSQGWQRVKLYFLTGVPTESRRGHARHRRARPRGRQDRAQVHEEGELHRVGRRVRAEAAHAVPVVRPEQRRASCTARSGCCATTCKRSGATDPVARPVGDLRRGHRQPWRPPHRARDRAGVAGRRHVPGVERALPAVAAGSTRWRPKASTPTGTSPGTAPTTRSCPWDHIAAGLHRDFLWDDWQAALHEHGLPDCRWTPCYDCGVCTGYALEHVVASAVPPAGGSQGTGQGIDFAAACREPGHARERAAMKGSEGFPVRLGFTKRGKVRFVSHRDVARAFERAFRIEQLPLAFTLGFSPRPKVSFGLALSVGHESDAEYLDVELARADRPRAAARAALRRAARGHRRRSAPRSSSTVRLRSRSR